MILVDTSVWVDHLRRGDPRLVDLLEGSHVAQHPLVIGEIACGSLTRRAEVIGLLQALPPVQLAAPGDVLEFIERRRLAGVGIGYVDVHLLASTALTPGTLLWTRDRRLGDVARRLGCSYPEEGAH